MSGSGREPAQRGALELQAPAKINLYLQVLGRRADGFHELVTVLQTVDLCDTLRLQLRAREPDALPGAPDVRLRVSHEPPRAEPPGAEDGPREGIRGEARSEGRADVSGGRAAAGHDVPEGDDNLVVRAARALLAEAGATGDVGLDLHLHKRIPAGGGLGGGSSDAAAALLGLDRLLGAPCAPRLHALAAALGSDIPFFLHGGTALCTGRGEIVEPIEPPSPFRLTLFVPDFGTRTAAVYAALGAGPVTPAPVHAAHALRARIAGADEARLESLFRNDLQAAAARVQPALATLLAHAQVHLSGSGSTLFTFGPAPSGVASACRGNLICSRASRGNP
ncbi:MAG TPA: hypothetical protein VK824_04575 [Planctomycetota bacterium]|nr:hypothetical protein [Planctomycetota bacterium]